MLQLVLKCPKTHETKGAIMAWTQICVIILWRYLGLEKDAGES